MRNSAKNSAEMPTTTQATASTFDGSWSSHSVLIGYG